MSTRRRFLAGLALAPVAAQQMWARAKKGDAGQLLFVGTGTKTGSQGIYAYRFDTAHGELAPLGLAAEANTPSFLALSPDGKTLFAVSEVDNYKGGNTGSVTGYVIDKAAGKLAPINTVASGGAGPCHLTTDQTGKVLVVANYAGGSAASFQIGDDGKLSDAVSEFHYKSGGPGPGQNKDRQDTSHAHRATVSPDNRFVLINDLGLDMIHIYKLDVATAKLTPNDPPEWRSKAGAGPRALRFHPSGRWAYCVNELTSSIYQLAWDSTAGTLTLVAETPLLPPEGAPAGVTSTGAEIVFDHKGDFAYASNRGDDFLATLKVDTTTGKLTLLKRSSCGGSVPRHIALDPTEHWILAANQESNLIAVFRRSTMNGELANSGKSFKIQSPECVLFV
jgi:6-phosphogluconolactonase